MYSSLEISWGLAFPLLSLPTTLRQQENTRLNSFSIGVHPFHKILRIVIFNHHLILLAFLYGWNRDCTVHKNANSLWEKENKEGWSYISAEKGGTVTEFCFMST